MVNVNVDALKTANADAMKEKSVLVKIKTVSADAMKVKNAHVIKKTNNLLFSRR
jgi:hypothetical protein